MRVAVLGYSTDCSLQALSALLLRYGLRIQINGEAVRDGVDTVTVVPGRSSVDRCRQCRTAHSVARHRVGSALAQRSGRRFGGSGTAAV